MKAKVSLIDGSRSPNRTILSLSWPIILDQSFNTLIQYVDTAMVGSLGAIATAAVAVNASTIWLVNGTLYSFAAAYAVVIARHIGANQPEKIKKSLHQAFLAIIFLSLIVTLLMSVISQHLAIWLGVEQKVIADAISYLTIISLSYPFLITFMFLSNIIRSSGDTKTPLISNIFTNVVNVVGNFILIFPSRTIELFGKELNIYGAGMGVKGAAIATFTSHLLSATILFIVIITKESDVKVKLNEIKLKFDKVITRHVFRVGIPMALERITLSSGQIVLTVLITHLGTASLAAHHLAITAESITFMPVSGFSVAAATLVAQSLGAGKKELAKDFAKRVLTYGIALMSATGLFLYLAAPQLMSFFTNDQTVIALGARVLRIEAFAQPFFAMSIVIGGILRGAGDTKWPFIYSIIGMWIVRLLPAYILITFFNGNLVIAWSCMVADLFVRGLLNLYRYKKGQWVDVWKDG
ncbi:MAG: MATE family efflux transporter [Spirochaetia bacterium]|nr:MATE family efflux transporter [Spirochaetia bacterium]